MGRASVHYTGSALLAACVLFSAPAQARSGPMIFDMPTAFGMSRAYVCVPEGTDGPFPTVIFIPNQLIARVGVGKSEAGGYAFTDFCETLAEDGFLAIAPVWPMSEDQAKLDRLIPDTLHYLDGHFPEQYDSSRVVLMGSANGGALVMRSAAALPQVRALVFVGFTGDRRAKGPLASSGSFPKPVLILYARNDQQAYGSPDKLSFTLQFFKNLGATTTTVDYPGGSEQFDAPGPWWDALLAFLDRTLV